MKDSSVHIAITGATYRGNKGAAAMLQSSIGQLHERLGDRLKVSLLSAWPKADRERVPWNFVEVVPAPKKKTALVALPLAVLHRLLRWCGPVRSLLERNPLLKVYADTDLVLDEPGISFVDTRSAAMNVYAAISNAIPLLMGVPVVKYAQALGTFRKTSNRMLARMILPRIRLIIARGEITRRNLEEIGITKNVTVCTDGALTLPEDPAVTARVNAACGADPFFRSDRVVCLFPSAVVDQMCQKRGIDYAGILTAFTRQLTEKGYSVLILPNTVVVDNSGTQNNDLIVCDRIFAACPDKTRVKYIRDEMTPEEIVAHVGFCRFVVASRFHGMIFALKQRKPVMLIGWSHKYQEILDCYGLGKYATDFSSLTAESLMEGFEHLAASEEDILRRLEEHSPEVMESSARNIEHVINILKEEGK